MSFWALNQMLHANVEIKLMLTWRKLLTFTNIPLVSMTEGNERTIFFTDERLWTKFFPIKVQD